MDSGQSVEKQTGFFIVGIGASAGGLEALEAFFDNMPDSDQLAFVIVQHLSPDYKSLMGELLSKHTGMPIRQAEDGMALEAGSIYLIPRKKNMTIFNGVLYLSEQGHGLNLPIDIFFRSLAEDQGERAIGIILSGTGSDGTRGVRAIKEEGGIVMVQDEDEAKFNGMPRSAAATGIADYILPAGTLPAELKAFISKRLPTAGGDAAMMSPPPSSLNRIFMLIKQRVGVDLSFYKESTILRRIERRIGITKSDNLDDYLEHLEAHPVEVSTLFKEILIGVTKFFRDPEVFEAIEQQVLPEILGRKDPSDPVRLWIAGCSSGEEAYSFAILISEYCEQLGIHPAVKIFATDIDKDALEHASYGVYPESIAADAGPDRLARYFTRKGDKYQISQSIREMVVFAYHNIFKDPPFRRIDLISCRNLLIYLQPVLQKRVLNNFHFSLNSAAYLVLGSSETLGDYQRYFSTLDAKWKVFRLETDFVSDGATRPPGAFPGEAPDGVSLQDRALHVQRSEQSVPEHENAIEGGTTAHTSSVFGSLTGSARTQSTRRSYESLYERLIEDYMPPCAIIDEYREVHHLFGDTAPFLKLPYGRVDLDILKMARRDLSIPLGSALQSAMNERKEIVCDGIHITDENRDIVAEITVRPLRNVLDTNYYIVVFRRLGEQELQSAEITHYDVEESVRSRIDELEKELQHTRENLQATIEELETSNEELQATNEELLSSNEELQSTNEELQSVNEELITVNSEYQKKIEELSQLNDDVDNILTGTDIGTLFLDGELRIRKFTPPVARYFNIIKTDIGRPISDLSHKIEYSGLIDDIVSVTETLDSSAIEARVDDGSWSLVKIHPYRTDGKSIGGVVLTIVDITSRKRAEQKLELQYNLLTRTLEANPIAIIMLDGNGRVVFANSRASELLGADETTLVQHGYSADSFELVGPDGERVTQAESPFYRLLNEGTEVEKIRYSLKRSDGTHRTIELSANPIYNEHNEVDGAVFNLEEVT